MKNRIVSISLAVALILSVSLVGCGGEEIPEYNLTISTTEGGEVTAPGEGIFTYDEGIDVDLVAVSDEGYQFVEWTGDVDDIADVEDATTTITINGNYTIIANFEEISPIQYNLTIASTTGGSVAVPGEGTFAYDDGTVVDLVATSDEGYQFAEWTGDVGDIADVEDATTTTTMNGNYTITANFETIPPTQYSLTLSSTTGGSLTAPGGGIYTYDAGTVVSLVAIAEEGHHFVNWTGDVSTVGNASAPTTTITMNDNYSVIASFEEIPLVTYDLTISSTTGGSVTVPGEGTFTYNASTAVNLVATPVGGYHFVNWTGDVDNIDNAYAASTAITVTHNCSITANFRMTYYTLTMTVSGNGSTNPSVGQHSYASGTVVPIGATPASCHRFVDWTGNVGTVANPNAASTTIKMNGDYSIVANIEEEQLVSLNNSGLEACIRQTIGKPTGPLCPSDLETITDLTCRTSRLDGLEYCTNLERLRANYCGISDLSPLANLTSLTLLSFHWNHLTDLSPLSNLTNLTQLELHNNQISDLSPLSNLTNLTYLMVGSNPVSDISPLANLTNVTTLILNWEQITDISPLANLTNVRSLLLHHNQISDISPLANLTSLTYVQLEYNNISDISPLVQNQGLGAGDKVYLQYNLLSSDSCTIYIPELQARGVFVSY